MSKDNQRIITMSDLEQHRRWVFVYRAEFPVIEKLILHNFLFKMLNVV